MSGRRLFAIALIFVLASIAWMILAGSIQIRTDSSGGELGAEVSGLWGSPQVQAAPVFSYSAQSRRGVLDVDGSDLAATFTLDQRRKGLLWYATYVVDFGAKYRVSNPATETVDAKMLFTFPDSTGIYDGFAVKVDGKEVPVSYVEGQASSGFRLAPGATATVETGYRTNGMDSWSYSPNPGGAGVIRDFRLAMTTDFKEIDYPAEGVSPTAREETADGWNLNWEYESVVSGREIGLVMPKPQNPGPLVARITLFAPVSLLFFFAALILLTATRNVKLHPIHYGFLAAAFFAFDLLLAYLADQIDINVAFAIAAVTSVSLVVGYLLVVVGRNRALIEIAIAQFVFLVLFSYSFFFEGFTGLAITIGAVMTLAVFMIKTARVDWDEVFPRKEPRDAPQWAAPAAASMTPPAPTATTTVPPVAPPPTRRRRMTIPGPEARGR